MTGKILIAGATGIVGGGAAQHFDNLPDWEVITLSRRVPDYNCHGKHISLDLTRRDSCERVLGAIDDVTHVIYAALYERPDVVTGWSEPEHLMINDLMFKNFFDALEPSNAQLRHISIMQGAKAYAVHLRPITIPAKESWPRDSHPNFYWLQEDYIKEKRSPQKGWDFTIFRPHLVTGFAMGSPINMIAAIGAYAAIERSLGRHLTYPGGYPNVQQMSDVRLISQGFEWAAKSSSARNQTFNIANGDVVIWRDFFPIIAEVFGMRSGPDEARSLAAEMPEYGHVWDRIVDEHKLQNYSLEKLIGSSWQFADFVLGFGKRPAPTVLSTLKVRKAGFQNCLDSEDSLRYWLKKLQDQRILPR